MTMRRLTHLLVVTLIVGQGCKFDDSGGGGGTPIDAMITDAPTPDTPAVDALPTASSCAALHTAFPSLPNGIYDIDPGLPTGTPPITTFCLMDVAGGGWTLAQRTVWDFTASSALITSYATFYNQTIGMAEAHKAFRIAGQY